MRKCLLAAALCAFWATTCANGAIAGQREILHSLLEINSYISVGLNKSKYNDLFAKLITEINFAEMDGTYKKTESMQKLITALEILNKIWSDTIDGFYCTKGNYYFLRDKDKCIEFITPLFKKIGAIQPSKDDIDSSNIIPPIIHKIAELVQSEAETMKVK